MKEAASSSWTGNHKGSLGKAALDLVEKLLMSKNFGMPLSSMTVIESIQRSALNSFELSQILEIVTEGAIDEFSRGFQQEAMHYLSIAAHIRRAIRGLN